MRAARPEPASISPWPGAAGSAGSPRRTMPRNSARRSGTRCSGVPVTTSRPNPVTSASSGAATQGVTAATSGAAATYPMRPPAACIAVEPADGCGVPFAICTRPSAPMIRASQPITILAVSAFRSGCRRNRQASRASRIGTVHAPEPNMPRTKAPSGRPIVLPALNQVPAAARMAAPSAVRPSPSRRWAGSRSRALRPIARAAKPTAWARPIQASATTRPIQLTRITIGLADGGLRPYLRPFPGLLLPLRYRAPPGRPCRELRVAGRFAVLAGRGRPVVPPRGRAAPSLPSRERAALLGARVAMIPTVASFPAAAKHSRPLACRGRRPGHSLCCRIDGRLSYGIPSEARSRD